MKFTYIFLLLILFFSCTEDPIKDPEPLINDLKIEFQYVSPSSYVEQDGRILKTISGGTKPYTVTWYNNSEVVDTSQIDGNDNLINVFSGSYKIEVKDSANLVLQENVFLASYDTIISSPYLAAYPGSYWEYDNGSRDECNEYILTAYREYFSVDPHIVLSDSIYLPAKCGLIADNRRYTHDDGLTYTIVSDELGEVFTSSSRIEDISREVVAVDTSINIGEISFDSVIIMELSFGYAGDMIVESKFFYAKHIGLIKYEKVWDPDDSYSFECSKPIIGKVSFHLTLNNPPTVISALPRSGKRGTAALQSVAGGVSSNSS